jgi:hypothetical protein
MNIISFKNSNFTEIREKDENLRNIEYSLFQNVQITCRKSLLSKFFIIFK